MRGLSSFFMKAVLENGQHAKVNVRVREYKMYLGSKAHAEDVPQSVLALAVVGANNRHAFHTALPRRDWAGCARSLSLVCAQDWASTRLLLSAPGSCLTSSHTVAVRVSPRARPRVVVAVRVLVSQGAGAHRGAQRGRRGLAPQGLDAGGGGAAGPSY